MSGLIFATKSVCPTFPSIHQNSPNFPFSHKFSVVLNFWRWFRNSFWSKWPKDEGRQLTKPFVPSTDVYDGLRDKSTPAFLPKQNNKKSGSRTCEGHPAEQKIFDLFFSFGFSFILLGFPLVFFFLMLFLWSKLLQLAKKKTVIKVHSQFTLAIGGFCLCNGFFGAKQ